ncbi:MAG: glycine cleavage system aminomethyltransferase GcvT [Candidatus Hermodarchaeota archaeon]|nr:glycine cleavage system aminomethyltransferase GcvT [Candidatus Hermodarchaeota archaeon]
MTKSKLLTTHLHDWHEDHGAKMVSFAGFHMPLWYQAITTEHITTRKAAGIFDVTHMGRAMITGSEATQYLDNLLPTRIHRLENGGGTYSAFCTKNGGIVDDLFLFRLADNEYYMVVNGANRKKDFGWMKKHTKEFNVKISNISDSTPMFALQGPAAVKILQKLTSSDLNSVPRFHSVKTKLNGFDVIATRSGYTGEDGFEIAQLNVNLDKKKLAVQLWEDILQHGKGEGLVPVGLAARDTLRLEAGMALYGNDINENTSPYQARIGFIVHLKKEKFIGKEALVTEKAEKPQRLRVGLIMLEKGIPRTGNPIYAKGEVIGEVTSGSISPLLRKGVALGYVNRAFRISETLVHIEIGKKKRWAEIYHPKKLLTQIKKQANM